MKTAEDEQRASIRRRAVYLVVIKELQEAEENLNLVLMNRPKRELVAKCRRRIHAARMRAARYFGAKPGNMPAELLAKIEAQEKAIAEGIETCG